VSGEHRNSLSEIAYIAGSIDGEGTIGIYRQTGTKSFHLKVLITNCSPALFDWLRPGSVAASVMGRKTGRGTGRSIKSYSTRAPQ